MLPNVFDCQAFKIDLAFSGIVVEVRRNSDYRKAMEIAQNTYDKWETSHERFNLEEKIFDDLITNGIDCRTYTLSYE